MQWTLASAMVVGLAAWGGCGSPAKAGEERGADERSAVLRVMEAGRAALLAGNGQTACRLLTAHGRTRALGFQVDFAPTGTLVPMKRRDVPQTCEQILGAEWKREHLSDVNQSWTPDLKEAKFNVVSIDSDNAVVRLDVPGAYSPTVELSKTAHGGGSTTPTPSQAGTEPRPVTHRSQRTRCCRYHRHYWNASPAIAQRNG